MQMSAPEARQETIDMDLRLKGKSVLVTGASQGIGEGVARAFAEEGCHLHLVARSADRLAVIKSEIAASHSVKVTVHALDLTAPGVIDPLVEAVGDIDILVNNAGVIPSGNLWDVDESKWRAGWELKVFGYINLTRAISSAPRGARRRCAVIINNIGNGGEVFDPNYVAGTTGNASFLMAFTRAMGGHSLDDNIRARRSQSRAGGYRPDLQHAQEARQAMARQRGPLQGTGGKIPPEAAGACA